MRLSPREVDKLILHQAGVVAQKRYARGILLNYVEAVALISTQILEFIRDGESVSDLMNKGKQILGLNDVMTGVGELMEEVQIEGTFPDGTKLVTIHHPICSEEGIEKLALYGSGLKRQVTIKHEKSKAKVIPGETFIGDGKIALNKDRKTVEISVVNKGDRPVQVGSHFPFFEVNASLEFDREKAFGYRLNIPSGTAVRFESGEIKKVILVELSGEKKVYGGNDLIRGDISQKNKEEALQRATQSGFLNTSRHTSSGVSR